MSRGDRQGWFADPYGLHEQRYFSADWPTKLVRDGTVEGFDEPPSDIYHPAVAIIDEPAAEDLAHSGYRPRRRGPGFTTWYVITVVVVAAVVAVVIVGLRQRSEHERVAFVTQSAQRTVAERTAHVTFAGSVQVGGQTLTISGAGEIDFSSGADEQTVQMTVNGQQVVEKTITTGGHFYYMLSLRGVNLFGKSSRTPWLEGPVPAASQASLTSGDPRAAMLLIQRGDTVRALGTKDIGGVTCTGYAVTPSRQAFSATTDKEISALKLSKAQASVLRTLTPPTFTVWVDAIGLMRQIGVGLQIGAVARGTASGTVTETLSEYGAPVHIKAPPSRDVISLEKLLQMEAKDSGAKSVPWTASHS